MFTMYQKRVVSFYLHQHRNLSNMFLRTRSKLLFPESLCITKCFVVCILMYRPCVCIQTSRFGLLPKCATMLLMSFLFIHLMDSKLFWSLIIVTRFINFVQPFTYLSIEQIFAKLFCTNTADNVFPSFSKTITYINGHGSHHFYSVGTMCTTRLGQIHNFYHMGISI